MAPTDASTPDRSRWARIGGAVVASATLALMLATESRLAIVWDEGYTLGREARVRAWFQRVIDPVQERPDPPEFALVQPDAASARHLAALREHPPRTRRDMFRPAALGWYWPFAREEPHGHPPFYALVGLAGDLIAPDGSTLFRARLGPMIVFSLTAGLLFAAFAGAYGPWPACAAAGAWVLHPHLFALGHYAHYDALLSSLWVGSILTFRRAAIDTADGPRPRLGRIVLFGILAGCAAGTKFTGWLLPLPFLAWTILYRDRRALATLAIGGLVAMATLYLLNPPFWASPRTAVERFLHSNLSRAETINLPVLFLGRVVRTPVQSLPWYNALLWTAAATPVGFLGLACLRLLRARPGAGRPDRFGVLVLLHWASFLVLRGLPHTPGHDGVRQFLPAFGCLAMMAGLGASAAVEAFGRWGRTLVAASLAEGAVSVALMMPVPLSYFSPVVGGLPGASAIGLEPTYYWDALSGEALAWLRQHTPEAEGVRFATYPLSLEYLRQTGRLGRDPLRFESDRPAAWYVLQNRPGMFRPVDRELLDHARPGYVVAKWGVPLVWIYPHDEFERRLIALNRAGQTPGPLAAVPRISTQEE